MQPQAKTLGIETQVSFVGQVPPQEIPRFMAIADALVSPRIAGTNTPLKIYSFLKSGKPIVATNLWTHTQLLDSDKAILVDPAPKSLAEGLRLALFDPKAQQIARRAQQWAEQKFTYCHYLEKIKEILAKATRLTSK